MHEHDFTKLMVLKVLEVCGCSNRLCFNLQLQLSTYVGRDNLEGKKGWEEERKKRGRRK